jgi:hypothetical protein
MSYHLLKVPNLTIVVKRLSGPPPSIVVKPFLNFLKAEISKIKFSDELHLPCIPRGSQTSLGHQQY